MLKNGRENVRTLYPKDSSNNRVASCIFFLLAQIFLFCFRHKDNVSAN